LTTGLCGDLWSEKLPALEKKAMTEHENVTLSSVVAAMGF